MIRKIKSYFTLLYFSVKWFFNLIFRKGKTKNFTCMVGKTALVTGGNSGIGYAVSTLLASRGCKVIIADVENSESSKNRIISVTGNQNVTWKHLDLASLSSIRTFAKEMSTSKGRIDILINNAGVGLCKTKITGDNLNKVMQVNFFGPFLLTHLLIPSLKASKEPRIIFASSIQGFYPSLTLNNLEEELNPLEFDIEVSKSWDLYCNSKLCNILAAQEFGSKLAKHNITVNSADPGAASTDLFLGGDDFDVWYMKLIRLFRIYRIVLYFFGDDNFGGAQTMFHLATCQDLKNQTGQNFFCCRPFSKPPILKNRQFCEEVWKRTENIVNLKTEEKL